MCVSVETRRCRVCGCTDERACPGGCWWVEWDLCSACLEVAYAAADGFHDHDEHTGDGGALDVPDLGPCCCCGAVTNVRNIVCLSRRAPVAGTGWACLVCGLPPDGAVYVACDACVEAHASPREVVHGNAAGKGRLPVDRLAPGTFEHDMSRHPEAGEGWEDPGEEPHVSRVHPGDRLAERPGFWDDELDGYEEV